MKIFVTGATGTIGFAVAATLAHHGHDVLGLTRSPEKKRRLEAAEITPVVGNMDSPETWIHAAQSCETHIHCAAEFSERYMQLDRLTVQHLLELQPRLFLYTSGCWLYGNTGEDVADESTPIKPPALVLPRVETERLTLAANSPATRTLIIRPGCVYGAEGSLTAPWFESAGKERATRIIGDGEYRWAMVHVDDLAELYRLAAESMLGNEIFNAVDGGAATVRQCAEAVSRQVLGTLDVISTPLEEAVQIMGPVVECLTLDQRLDASKAAQMLGWQARHPRFPVDAGRYYRAWKALR